MNKETRRSDSSVNLSAINNYNMNVSCSSQTTLQTMQREIDNYTRLLEQEKRKYFRVQENHQEIMKDYKGTMKQIQNVKSKRYKTQMSKLKGSVKTLQSSLEQTISSFNDAVCKNNMMKNEIDELRKQKKNQKETLRQLEEKIKNINIEIQNKKNNYGVKKNNIEQIKRQILSIRDNNIEQAGKFRQKINEIISSHKKTQLSNNKKKNESIIINDCVDTQPLTKLRLKNIIFQNKEKLRIIEQYKKSMQLIFNNFEEIKQQSGINNLEQITSIFIKQQEQNMFICQYINKLHTELEDLTDENKEIRNKIQIQKDINIEYKNIVKGTSQQQTTKIRLEKIMQERKAIIRNFDKFLQQIKPFLQQFKQMLLQGTGQTELIVNQYKIEQYFCILENNLNQRASKVEINNNYKQTLTCYSKIIPTINNQEIKDKLQDQLLEVNKLREYASEYWKKKKIKTNRNQDNNY